MVNSTMTNFFENITDINQHHQILKESSFLGRRSTGRVAVLPTLPDASSDMRLSCFNY